MLKKINKNKKGFTLIELIVVIAILLLISVLAVVGFGNIIDNARDSAMRADAARLAGQVNNFNTFAATGNRILTEETLRDQIDGNGNVDLTLRSALSGPDGNQTGGDAIDGEFSISLEFSRIDSILEWLVEPAGADADSGIRIWTVRDPDLEEEEGGY